MNKDIIQGNLTQLKGRFIEAFGKITGDEYDQARGRKDVLIGHLQERYGWAKDEAESRLGRTIDRDQPNRSTSQ